MFKSSHVSAMPNDYEYDELEKMCLPVKSIPSTRGGVAHVRSSIGNRRKGEFCPRCSMDPCTCRSPR